MSILGMGVLRDTVLLFSGFIRYTSFLFLICVCVCVRFKIQFIYSFQGHCPMERGTTNDMTIKLSIYNEAGDKEKFHNI